MMLNASTLTTPLAAFVAGLVTSIHCTGMCGPLTCAAFGKSRSTLPPSLYQLARITAYSLVGGILGTVGRSAAFLFNAGPAKIVPWAFALLFLAFAFQLEKRIPQPRFFAKFLLRAKLASMKPTTVATVLGLVTPLLPCGPLYLVLGVSLLPGSFIGGAFLMTSFALGTAPLFFLLQTQFTRIPLSAQSVQLTRRGLAFVSAMLLIWRAASGTGIATPGLCPFCHY